MFGYSVATVVGGMVGAGSPNVGATCRAQNWVRVRVEPRRVIGGRAAKKTEP